VAPQGFGTDQAAVGPSQGLLQHATIPRAPKLRSPTAWGSQPPIEADGQHQAQAGHR